MNRQQRYELALRRRAGASPQACAKMSAAAHQWDDWYTSCPRCGARLRGRLVDLEEHRCEPRK